MTAVPLSYYILLSFVLFSIGVLGVMIRRNVVVVLMSVELMLNGANLAFVAFSNFRGDESGQVMAFFVMALAAAEAAVGLAIVIAAYKHFRSLSLDEMNTLKG